jgi:calcineurin-like phosphoesterase family protein
MQSLKTLMCTSCQEPDEMVPSRWMTGIRVLIIITTVASLVVCPAIAISITGTPEISKEIKISSMGPVVSGTNQNSTVIRMISDNPCTPSLRYANESYFSASQEYDREVFNSSNGTHHAIQIAELEPATSYHYLASGCGIPDVDRTFSTFPETGSCTFIVYGDTREQAPLYNQTERHKLVADRIAQEKNILFVVNSGDLVSDSNDAAEWSRFIDATEKVRSMTTYIAVPGNHDDNRSLFRQLFGTDNTTFFDCGNTRIALLDSTDMSSMTMEDQEAWLESALRSYEGAKVVIMHYPVYSSDEKHYGGWENIQRTLVPAFQKSGVRLVFNSHVHAFEQVDRDGITYITEARGGAPDYPLKSTRIPGSVRAIENTLGYSRVTVDPQAGMISIDVIRVADVSGDLRTVTRIYPEGTIDAQIRIPFGSSYARFPDIFEQICFLKDMKDSSSCRNPYQNAVPQFL